MDRVIFYRGTLPELLITNVPGHEIYIRILILICFILFGLIAARLIEKQKIAEKKNEELISGLQNALERVKLLSGLLPVCSSCKKIRDEEGHWTQIELYIRDRSEADFTHSVCPDCFKRLYPEIKNNT
ncbi:MAG: hypothetical protein JSV21_11170 [Nitrospirota bacterium]|nr:MAG: hypothetical protein JSV21_11170 [Nitrospirota bacterium]